MNGQRGVCRRVTRRDVVKSGAAAGVGLTLLGARGTRSLARRPGSGRQNDNTIAFIQGVIADNLYFTMD